jgi:surfeit locus 1 family protein
VTQPSRNSTPPTKSIARIAGIAWLPTLAALVVLIATVMLGSWQVRRAAEKQTAADQREVSDRTAPRAYKPMAKDLGAAAMAANSAVSASTNDSATTPVATNLAQVESQRITVRGVFEPERSVFIDNRTYKGQAGFHVVTPLRLQNSEPEGAVQRIAVLRGWIAADIKSRNALPALKLLPEGIVEITGLAQQSLGKVFDLTSLRSADPALMAPPSASTRLWQQFDLKPYRQWLGVDLEPVILRQFSALDDGLVRDWPQPASGISKHQGYAFQWFCLSALTAGLWVYFVLIRPSRASKLSTAKV